MSKNVKTGLIIVALIAGGFTICGLTSCGGGGGGDTVGDPPIRNPDVPNNPQSGGGSGNTVLGSADTNSNEVPDEVDEWIASIAPSSAKTRAALTQNAVVYTHALLDADNKALSRDHAREMGRAIACVIHLVGARVALDLSDELEAQFLNSNERSEAYIKYDGHLGGTSPLAPSDGSTCDFNLASLPN